MRPHICIVRQRNYNFDNYIILPENMHSAIVMKKRYEIVQIDA